MAPPFPKLTIVMATYNRSNVLPFSIGSALAQSFANFEMLVVGDGCTDDSEAVVGAIGDERLRWINLPANNGHQSAPNNEGIRQARGDLIAYLGHDDLWLPHHLEVLVDAIEAGADMAYGATRRVARPGSVEAVPACGDYRPGTWVPPSSVVHRRSLIDRVGGWGEYRTLECDPETDLWRRFHQAGARIAFVPRLGTIKIPASARRDVYRERPVHEQAAYFERIREEKTFEAVELSRMLAALVARHREKTYWELLAEIVQRTVAGIGRRFAPGKPGSAIEANRLFKGLGPALDRDTERRDGLSLRKRTGTG